MPAIYQADVWCDSCAQEIRERLQKVRVDHIDEDDERSYDSDEFPKRMGDDEESDSPQHCGSGEECLEAETLPSGRKVGALFGSLTSDGIEYVKDAIVEGGEVAEFWRVHYTRQGYDLGDVFELANRVPEFAEFWENYCESLCFTASEDSNQGDVLFPASGEFTDTYPSCARFLLENLDHDELKQLRTDAAGFFLDARNLIVGREAEAGRDFNFTRCGHGSGYLDGDWPDFIGEKLAELSKAHGPLGLYGTRTPEGEIDSLYLI